MQQAQNEVNLAMDREQKLQKDIEDAQRTKENLISDIEEIRRHKADMLEPQLIASTKELKVGSISHVLSSYKSHILKTITKKIHQNLVPDQ